jgi:iron complex transport system substrate-binding protein
VRAIQVLAIAIVLVAIATFFTGHYVSPPKTITTTQTVAYTITTTVTQAEASRHEVKYPITIVNSAGRTVTIEKEPQRVVVIASTQAMV